MAEKYLIGVDLGTSATKSVVYRTDGTIVAEANLEVPLYYPKPGIVEQENDDFYKTASATVRQCIDQSGIEPGQVAAIAFDSQMAGIGSIYENFQPATRFDSWLDMRCQPYIDQMDRKAGGRIIQLTGCPPTCDHGPKILWWMHERPKEYARIAKFVTPAGFVAGKMGGLKADQAFMDYTFIHFTGLCDSQNYCWSDELCDLFNVDINKLPRIVKPWEIVGEVTDRAAKDFGLKAGTPIAAGCGDTAACALGAGVVKPGMVYDTAGTASALAATTDQFVADVKHRTLLSMHSVITDIYNPLAYIAGGGIALRWFRDQFYNTCRGEMQKMDHDLYDEMIASAGKIEPGCDGLFFSPHLGGRICPSASEMRGAWLGFSWGHTQYHFFRAILESIAFEYAFYLKILRDQLPDLKFEEARVVGGGARSRAWNQIKADVLGIKYQSLKHNEFGAWGTALIAGKSVGLFDDLSLKATETSMPEGDPVLPNLSHHGIYSELVNKYITSQEMLQNYYRE